MGPQKRGSIFFCSNLIATIATIATIESIETTAALYTIGRLMPLIFW